MVCSLQHVLASIIYFAEVIKVRKTLDKRHAVNQHTKRERPREVGSPSSSPPTSYKQWAVLKQHQNRPSPSHQQTADSEEKDTIMPSASSGTTAETSLHPITHTPVGPRPRRLTTRRSTCVRTTRATRHRRLTANSVMDNLSAIDSD